MCRPSLLPGGVSSAADASAEAVVEAGWEGDIESFRLGAYPALRPVRLGRWLDREIVCELVLVTELADAEIELLC